MTTFLLSDPGNNPTVSSTLSAEINPSVITIGITDSSTFPKEGTVIIGSEHINYFGISSNDLINCVRGANGTTAAEHSSGATVTTRARLVDKVKTTANSTITTFELNDARNFPSVGVILVGTEKIKYFSKSSNSLSNCIRGFDSTTAASHSADTEVTIVERSSQKSTDYTADTGLAGWYEDRGVNNPTLRLADSNLILTGVVKLNKTTAPYKFQGYDGANWVDFNSTQGATGSNGRSFNDVVNFNNVGSGQGNVFKTTLINSGNDTVQVRSLTEGTFNLNAGVTSQKAIDITQSTDTITLAPRPQPYMWNFASNNTINDLKSSVSDTKFKAWGTTSRWIVRDGKTVKKGEPVRIYGNDSVLRIEPFTYSTTPSCIAAGFSYLGISLQDVSGASNCDVCTQGITTVICGEASGSDSPTSNTNIAGVGAYGFINRAGRVYNPSAEPTTNHVRAGYFLQSGVKANDNSSVLFYVKGGFEAI